MQAKTWGALLLLVSAAAAQEPATGTVRAEAREVRLTVTASDALGGPAALAAQDLQISEDGRAVPALTSFYRLADEPLECALLVDASASTRRRFAFEVAALRAFLREAMRPGDAGMVVSFGQRVEVLQEATGDRGRLENALAALKPADESTRLFDAVVAAVESLGGRPAGQRRVVILLSDGEDTASNADQVMAEEAAQRADAVIYAVSLERDTEGEGVMRSLAASSGGRFFAARDEEALQRAFTRIGIELREQYVATFRPGEGADGRFHVLRATTTRRDVRLRTRSGYFATQ